MNEEFFEVVKVKSDGHVGGGDEAMAIFFVVCKKANVGMFRQSELLIAKNGDLQVEVFDAGEELTEFVLVFSGKVGVKNNRHKRAMSGDFELFCEFFPCLFFCFEEVFEVLCHWFLFLDIRTLYLMMGLESITYLLTDEEISFD